MTNKKVGFEICAGMKKRFSRLTFYLLIVCGLAACKGAAAPAVEDPGPAPQTIALTRTAPVEGTSTPTPSAAAAQQTPAATPIPQLFVDPAYYQGIIVITQY